MRLLALVPVLPEPLPRRPAKGRPTADRFFLVDKQVRRRLGLVAAGAILVLTCKRLLQLGPRRRLRPPLARRPPLVPRRPGLVSLGRLVKAISLTCMP